MFECDSFFKFGLSKALIGVLLELMICADLQVPYIYQDVLKSRSKTGIIPSNAVLRHLRACLYRVSSINHQIRDPFEMTLLTGDTNRKELGLRNDHTTRS